MQRRTWAAGLRSRLLLALALALCPRQGPACAGGVRRDPAPRPSRAWVALQPPRCGRAWGGGGGPCDRELRLSLRGGEAGPAQAAVVGDQPGELGAGEEPIQCVIESDVWGPQSRRKWTGSASGPGALRSRLIRHYNHTLPQRSQSRLLLQYYDAEVDAFVDLLDGDGSWRDFHNGVGAKRLRLVAHAHPPGAQPADEPQILVRARQTGGRADNDSAGDGDETSDGVFEGDTTKEIGRGGISVQAFVMDTRRVAADAQASQGEPEFDIERGSGGHGAAEDGVKARIRKMLELGLHKDTGEDEARQALANAMRLLTKHNLKHADVLLNASSVDAGELKGGLKVVELKGSAAKQLSGWMHELGHLAAEAFDVNYYTVTSRRVPAQIIFYGVESNAACAAYAFAASFNRIVALSAATKISREVFEAHRRSSETTCTTFSAFTRIWRASYRAGLVRGLRDSRRDGAGGEGGGAGREADRDSAWKARYEQLMRESMGEGGEEGDDESVAATGSEVDGEVGGSQNLLEHEVGSSLDVTRWTGGGGAGQKAGGGGACREGDAWEKAERKVAAMILHTKTIGDQVPVCRRSYPSLTRAFLFRLSSPPPPTLFRPLCILASPSTPLQCALLPVPSAVCAREEPASSARARDHARGKCGGYFPRRGRLDCDHF